MGATLRVNIVFSDNGSGLSRDARVLHDALRTAGHRVSLTPRSPRAYPTSLRFAPELTRQTVRRIRQRATRAWTRGGRRWDVNIFLESLVAEHFGSARANCYFPNQEWISDRDQALLPDVDMVLFKTRHAMAQIGSRAKAAEYVGFSSPDVRDPRVVRQHGAALHVSGWNPHKGTGALLAAWREDGDWPHLVVVSQTPLPSDLPANVQHIGSRLSERRLRRLQNLCSIHLCPSEVEGFGHTLMEALSCGAVVVTTNAPPMDELVTPDVGVLVPHASTSAMRSGMRYLVSPAGLTEALRALWRADAAAIRSMRTRARARYESLRQAFHARLLEVLEQM